MRRAQLPDGPHMAVEGQVRPSDHVPDDGICAVCERLVRGHSGVERLLAARGIQYYDPERNRMVRRGAVPYCKCEEDEVTRRRSKRSLA